jgi:NTP pyrophosphatase (non-canonical NTP hydrolase)
MTHTKEETLQQALKQNGVPQQLNQSIEECAELIQAINKARRHQLITDTTIIHPEHLVSIEDCLVFGNLVSEIADVSIMLEQLTSLVGEDRVEFEKERKSTRLQTRLDKAKTRKD